MATESVTVAEEPVACAEMCAYAFDVLLEHFGRIEKASPRYNVGGSCPLFVTLNKFSRRGKSLRGCIGCLSPRPLSEIKEYTYSSAFRDRRFEPLLEPEIPSLEIGISLLVNYEKGDNYLDWQVGTHGIIIEFTDHGQRYSATYLPEVAPEQAWTQQEAVDSLIRKAGYRAKITQALLASIELTRYQSSKFRLSYDEYMAMAQMYAN